MEKNIVNVYRFCDSENSFFLYSIRNRNNLLGYSYFILTGTPEKPSITKLDNAIAFLQSNGLKLRSINQQDDDYNEFVSLFSSFVRLGNQPAKIFPTKDQGKLLKYPSSPKQQKKN